MTNTKPAGRRLGRLLPVVAVLRGHPRTHRDGWLRADILAGVTVAAYLIPQVMAYAQVAGLPPATGLQAAVVAMLVYPLLGSSARLSLGPESTTALMTAVTIAPLAAGDPVRYAALAAMLALLVGVVLVLARLARLGVLADLLSKPVLAGYLAGTAAIMIIGQLGRVTRLDLSGDSTYAELGSFLEQAGSAHLPTVVMAGGALVFLLVLSRLAPKVPVPLAGVLLATLVSAVFALRHHGIDVVGTIPAGFSAPAVPAVSAHDLAALVLPAIGVAVVGFSDTVLTARSFALRDGGSVDANAELLALGGANLVTGVLQGFPVSSSASRTAIATAVGSRSQLYSLVAVSTVALVLLLGRPVLGAFPQAALGALVIFAALRLIDLGEFRRFGRFRRSELVLALSTTVAVLAFGILYGILAAIALSILDLLRRVARPHDGILGYVRGVAGMHDVDDYPGARVVPGLVVYRYDAPLCFANAEDFHTRALRAVDRSPTPVERFLLNMEANVEVDITAVDALDQLRTQLHERGVEMALARVKQDLRDQLQAAGFLDRLGVDHVYPTLPVAVRAHDRAYATRHGHLPHPATGDLADPVSGRVHRLRQGRAGDGTHH